MTNWYRHSKSLTVDTIGAAISRPSEFQIELSDLLDEYLKDLREPTCVEAGCEQATVSFLLQNAGMRHLLDLNLDIVNKLQSYVKQQGLLDVSVISGDMFMLPFEDESVELVHNSGVIEHFHSESRGSALGEYARIVRPDGLVIVALPNHKSIPYRTAYLFHTKILRGRFWKWPPEYKIDNLADDASGLSLKLEKRICLAKNTAFRFWRPFGAVSAFFRFLDRFYSYEGYLEVYIFRKTVK